jgi:hypothetical protein
MKFYERFSELKNSAADYIEDRVLNGNESNFRNVGIYTRVGYISKIKMDSAGCFVSLDKVPVKLRELQNEVIIQIASYLDNSWDGDSTWE